MEQERESDFMEDMRRAVIGNIYRCSDCNRAYYIEGVDTSRSEGVVSRVRAFDLTNNLAYAPTNESVAFKFRRIRDSDLSEQEHANLRNHRLDLAREYFEKQGLGCSHTL